MWRLCIAETAPSDLRGKLVSLKEAAIVAGIIVGYLAGASLGGQSPSFSIEGIESWRTMFLTALPLELAMAVGAFGLAPESPRWLALRQRSEEAEEALVRCQGLEAQDAKQQVEAMTRASASEAVGGEDGGVSGQFAEIFDSPYNKKALYIGVGLVLLQQLSGQPSVLYYANRILKVLAWATRRLWACSSWS